jgi:hypothetical protein
MAEGTDEGTMGLVGTLPNERELEDTALLDLANCVLPSDGDSEVASCVIDGLFEVDGAGSISELEGVGAFVTLSSCRRAIAFASASAVHAASAT